jgi:tRNA(Ile)-lysidine synthase
VRHDLWPAVVALAPSAERAIARAADLARDDERALARRAREIVGASCALPVAALAREPLAVRRRIVRRLWRNATGRMAGLEAQHVDAILSVARRRKPGRVTLPGGRAASCRYGTLRLGEPMEVASHIRALEVPSPGRYAIPGRGVAIEVSARRADALPWPLELRTRRPGDRFRPDGGRGSKKLKAWLIDRKIPREARDGLLVLAHGASVLAVPELAAVAAGLGPSGVGLIVRVTSDR